MFSLYDSLFEVLYFSNLFFFISLSIAPLIFLKNSLSLPWLNPLTISFLVLFPIEVCKAILGPLFSDDLDVYNKYYQFSLLMENLRLFFVLLVSVLFIYLIKNKKSNYIPIFMRINSKGVTDVGILSLQFLFLFLALFIFYEMTSNTFGFINWINDPRTGYQYHRAGFGAHFALSLSFLSLSFVFALLRTNSESKAVLIALLYIGIVYFWGAKGFILTFFVFSLIYLWFLRGRLLIPLFVFGGVGVFSLLLINLASSYGGVDFNTFFKYFDHYENSALFYELYFNDELDLFYGGVVMTDFWSLVPRAIYPDKPFVYGLLHVNEIFFPGAAELGHTPAFGGPVASFSDFGVIGIAINTIFDFSYFLYLYALFYIFKFRKLDVIRSNTGLMIAFMLVFSPSFLHYVPSIYGVLIVLFLVFLVFTLGKIRFLRINNATY